MRYAKFGNTDMVVSEIALGTWGIGGASWDDNSEDTRLDAIRSAVESGINFIDTAPAYKGGVAESYVGKVISSMGIRKELYLVTKCPMQTGNEDRVLTHAVTHEQKNRGGNSGTESTSG